MLHDWPGGAILLRVSAVVHGITAINFRVRVEEIPSWEYDENKSLVFLSFSIETSTFSPLSLSRFLRFPRLVLYRFSFKHYRNTKSHIGAKRISLPEKLRQGEAKIQENLRLREFYESPVSYSETCFDVCWKKFYRRRRERRPRGRAVRGSSPLLPSRVKIKRFKVHKKCLSSPRNEIKT